MVTYMRVTVKYMYIYYVSVGCVCVQDDQTFDAALYGLAFSILGSFGFTFLISSFVVFPVRERECKVYTYTCTYIVLCMYFCDVCTMLLFICVEVL